MHVCVRCARDVVTSCALYVIWPCALKRLAFMVLDRVIWYCKSLGQPEYLVPRLIMDEQSLFRSFDSSPWDGTVSLLQEPALVVLSNI